MKKSKKFGIVDSEIPLEIKEFLIPNVETEMNETFKI